MAYKFQFRDVFAQQDAILDGMVADLKRFAGVRRAGDDQAMLILIAR